MPLRNRVIWYIYSRNLLQKGGNFTHFAKKDFNIFTSILDKQPQNVGHWVFQEMAKFAFHSRKSSQIPFASLVSVILFHEKIWYLAEGDQVVTPPDFSQHIGNLKKTPKQEGSEQSRAPRRSVPAASRATQSRANEAQSAPPSSDLAEKIQGMIDKAVSDLVEGIEHALGPLVTEVSKGHNNLVDVQEHFRTQQEAMQIQLNEQQSTMSTMLVTLMQLNDKMDRILQHQASTSTASEPAPEPEVASTPVAPVPEHDHIPEDEQDFVAEQPAEPAPESATETIDPSATPTIEPLALPAHEYTDCTPHFEPLLGKSSFTPAGAPDPTIISPTPLTVLPPSFDDDKGGEDQS